MTLSEIISAAQMKHVKEDDLIDEIWEWHGPVPDKVSLSLELFDQQHTYHVLATMWRNYYSTSEVTNALSEVIYQKYIHVLSQKDRDPSNSMEYSLYFDIFEDPDRNEHAWTYFLSANPSEHLLKIMLANSGPVPYHLKHPVYEMLLPSEHFHLHIFKSIHHSIFDNCGQVDKDKALIICKQLQWSAEGNERGYLGYAELIDHLSAYRS